MESRIFQGTLRGVGWDFLLGAKKGGPEFEGRSNLWAKG